MERRYNVLNVFTKLAEGGNPLAVVTDVDGLDDSAMQSLAQRIGLSETVFVFPPENQAHTAAIRIFTPKAELPFAGHPTIGTAVYLTQERIWRARDTGFDTLSALEARSGVLRVAVKPGTDGAAAFAEFDAPGVPEEAGEAAPEDRIAAALGLSPTEIGFENFKPRRMGIGAAFTFVPVDGLEAIGRAEVIAAHWEEAFGGDGHGAAYLYCRDTIKHKAAFHARCFAPSMGVPEDPATGSAAASFAGIINHFDGPPEGTYEGIIEQGHEMGRPSEIFLEFEVLNREIRVVRIGGFALAMGEKTIEI
jgi:trans-2,3-dihydro-3-hydroxyanthranilate isomerase